MARIVIMLIAMKLDKEQIKSGKNQTQIGYDAEAVEGLHFPQDKQSRIHRKQSHDLPDLNPHIEA